MPVSGSFIRMGSKWVDEAFGFMLGWNFFLYGTHYIAYSPNRHGGLHFCRGGSYPLGNQCLKFGFDILER